MDKFLASAKSFFVNAGKKAGELFSALKEKLKSKNSNADSSKSLSQKILTGVGAALCVIFSLLLICNMVIIIKGSVSPEKPPSVFGTTPMVVLSGSMSGDAEDHIEVGDLVFINKADPEKLKVGDVIAFMEGSTTVTHRIIRIETGRDGEVQWITKGDANNAEDKNPVTADNLVGIYSFRIPGVGNFALFLQEPVGMLLFIGVPCLAFIVYDIIRRQRSAVKQDKKASEMEAELERLRKLIDEKQEAADVDKEASEDDKPAVNETADTLEEAADVTETVSEEASEPEQFEPEETAESTSK